MKTPVQIAFHQIAPSAALEARIRELADELDVYFQGITSCRVAVEMPHRHHHQGQRYRVAIELHVPGEQIVVGRAAEREAAHEDAYAAVHDAFRAAKRQLKAHAQKIRHEVKAHVLGAREG
jgi:ribosome-associated translation inhibitor RaiA